MKSKISKTEASRSANRFEIVAEQRKVLEGRQVLMMIEKMIMMMIEKMMVTIMMMMIIIMGKVRIMTM